MIQTLQMRKDVKYFTPVQPKRGSDMVAEQIEAVILSGRLKTGNKLPPEREIIKLFDISRRTLREALRILEQKGLIQVKQGSQGGAFVIDKVPHRVSENLLFLIRQKKVSTENIVDFRIQAEGHVAELVAEKIWEENLCGLEDLFSKARELLHEEAASYDEILALESELHLKLAEMSGNVLYAIVLKAIHDVLVLPSYEFDPVDTAYVERAVSDWGPIIEAIRKHRSADVRTLMEDHIKYFAVIGKKLKVS
jgi:GntR family transcriptional regulator, transcriptional repressor for pyruvate dehydrogenase complex